MLAKRSYEEILNFLLEKLSSETDISLLTPGGVARTMMEIVSKELSTDFNIFDYNFSQAFLSTATGPSLNNFGRLFGLTRKTVDPTVNAESKVVYFYLNDAGVNHDKGTPNLAASVDITIPAGTYVSTDEISSLGNPILWKTSNTTVIPSRSYLAYTSVEPVSGGEFSVSPGKMINHALNVAEFPNLYVFNKGTLSNQPQYESDDNYRYRISNSLRLLASGNGLALQIATLSIGGVRDVKIIPLGYGIGTIKVIVVPEKPGTGDASAAKTRVKGLLDEVKSVGDILYVELADSVKIDLAATLTIDNAALTVYNRNGIIDNATSAVRKHINSLSVGNSLSISSIIGVAVKSSPFITDCTILSSGGIMVNDIPHDLSTITAKENQQIYAGTIQIS